MSLTNKLGVPILLDINWIENGKIILSFKFDCIYTHNIEYYEIYYCYINDSDNNWFKYAQNNWRTITIPSTDQINKNIELRIATFHALYDETKNKNIELIMKIRCQLKTNSWIHKFYSEFSDIYFVRSLSIPSILGKQTDIDNVLTIIFNDNKYNKDQQLKAKQNLSQLYDSFKNSSDIIHSFTHLIIKYTRIKYANICDKLLNNSQTTLMTYLLQIEQFFKYEREQLFPYINKYCNENDRKNILCSMIDVLFDLNGFNNKMRTFIEDKNVGIKHLFLQLFNGKNKEHVDRFMVFYDYMNTQTKNTLNGYLTNIHIEYLISNNNANTLLVNYINQYYTQKSNIWLNELNCSQYLMKTEKCIENEELLGTFFYDKSCIEDILTVTRQQLFQHHHNELLSKPTGMDFICKQILNNNDDNARSDLARLYRLGTCVPNGSCKIAEIMKNVIFNLGMSYIENSKQSKQSIELINLLINLHDIFLNIIKIQCHSEQVFHKALKEAFEQFMNIEYYTSVQLAHFANNILTKKYNIKNTNTKSIDFDNIMDHIIMLYGYIGDKDVFESEYQSYLANRLLCNLCISEQCERSMIGKLKTESGYHWTSKLEDMFKDIQKSQELMIDFRKLYGEFECDLNVNVCTTGAWPNVKHMNELPNNKQLNDIVTQFKKFKQFYCDKFSGRYLQVVMQFGNAEILVHFNANTAKILVVSTYQMIVLLLFNDKNIWRFEEIFGCIGIGYNNLCNAILSMAHPKIKILRKSPNNKEIGNSHKFSINPNYTRIGSKVYVPTLNIFGKTKDIMEGSNDKNMENIQSERREQIDTAIKRIMLVFGTIRHSELVVEVVKQLRNNNNIIPKPVDIKKRIANLIELGHIERDEFDRQLYHYINGDLQK